MITSSHLLSFRLSHWDKRPEPLPTPPTIEVPPCLVDLFGKPIRVMPASLNLMLMSIMGFDWRLPPIFVQLMDLRCKPRTGLDLQVFGWFWLFLVVWG